MQEQLSNAFTGDQVKIKHDKVSGKALLFSFFPS